MSDMRLLIIISAFSRGGAQKVLLDLIPEWAKKGIKIRIILLQDSEDELDYTSLKILGIEVIRIKATSFFDVKVHQPRKSL